MAILSRRQTGHFIEGCPTATLSRPSPMASLSKPIQWQFYQGAKPAILSKVVQRPLYQGQAQWRVYQSQSNGSFIKAGFTTRVNRSQWPLYQGLQFSSKVAAVPGRAAARFQLWRANPILRRASNLSTDNCCFIKAGCNNASLSQPMAALSKPMAVLSRPANFS